MKSSSHADALNEFPLFLKPVAEGTSKGIYPCSKIKERSELEPAVSMLSTRYPDQDILIETYLAGREFTVSIIGTGSRARVVGALEFQVHRQEQENGVVQDMEGIDFLTTDLKKYDRAHGVHVEVLMPDLKSDREVQQACEKALEAYKAVGCRDLGRVDVRSDRRGSSAVPHIIEVRRTGSVCQFEAAQVTDWWCGQVNPRPGLRPDRSHFPSIARNNGLSYGSLIEKIIDSAAERMPIKQAPNVNGFD